MKLPKRKGYANGGTTDPPDWSKITRADQYPTGYANFPAVGYVELPGVKSASGQPVYYDPKTVNISASTPTTSTDNPVAPAAVTTPAPTTPATTTPAPAPTRNDQRESFKKALEAWEGGSAQKVPTEIANEIQNNIRTNVQAKQAILDAAAAKKYGSKSGPVKGQQLSYDEAAKALGGKEVYDDFLQDIYSYENYRAKTKGTYDTQNVTWGATDPNEKMYGFRMSNMFKNTDEQSAANTKKTPQNVLDWQKNPVLPADTSVKKPDAKTILLDNNNESIPVMTYDATGQPIIKKVEKPITAFKRGGTVKKRKGYADGSFVEPDLSGLTPEQMAQYNALVSPSEKQAMLAGLTDPTKPSAVSGMTSAQKAIGSLAPVAGQIASNVVDNNVNVDPNNNKAVIAKDALSSALNRAGQGAAIGSMIPGVGTVIGAGAGTVIGGIEGMIKGKKKARAFDEQAAEENIASAQGASMQLSGHKDGGTIEGPGTAKSDSIKAEIKAGSFVVPAENAGAAERIRKLYLRPTGKAKLSQAAGTPVKLSDGEHLFSPEEVTILRSRGVDLDALAPNQEEGKSGLQKGGIVPGYKNGGGVDDINALIAQAEKQKAAQAAKQKAEDEKHAKEKEAGRVSAIQESNYLKQKAARDAASAELDKWVNIVKSGMKTDGTYDSSSFTEATGDLSSDLEKLKSAKQKYDSAFGVEKTAAVQVPVDGVFDVSKRNAITGDANTPSAKKPISTTSDTTTPSYTQVGDKWIDQNGKEVTPPKLAGTKSSGTTGPGGAENKQEIDRAFQAAFLKEHGETPSATSQSSAVTSTNAIDNLKAQYAATENLNEANSLRQQMHDLGYNTDGTPIMSKASAAIAGLGNTSDAAQAEANADVTGNAADPVVPASAVQSVFDKLGGAAGLLAIGQVGLGAGMALKNKPPVDKVDPRLLEAQQRALENASYGLSPEQLALNRGKIETNRRDVMGNISQTSGGNAGTAIANSRLATLDANSSNLALASADQNLKQNKQVYADNITSQVAAAKKQIFNEKLSQSMMSQKAAADLMGAGFANLTGAMSLNNQQNRMDERARKYPSDPWQAIIAQQQAQTPVNY